MRNLKYFGSISESAQTMPLIGFVFYFEGTFYYGAYPTFQEFADAVASYYGVNDDDRVYLDPYYLYADLLQIFTESESIAFKSMSMWTCLTPRGNTKFFDRLSYSNPFSVCKILLNHFSDVSEIMTKYPEGNEGEPRYLSLSIDNNHSLIDSYAKYDEINPGEEYDENMFTLKDILDDLKTDSKDLQALAKYYKMKNYI